MSSPPTKHPTSQSREVRNLNPTGLDSSSLSSLLSGDLENEGTGEQREGEEEAAEESSVGDLEVNPYDGLPFSSRYYALLEERRHFPIWRLRRSLLELLENHNMVLLSAPSGAGKSTQVSGKHSIKVIQLLVIDRTLKSDLMWSSKYRYFVAAIN